MQRERHAVHLPGRRLQRNAQRRVADCFPVTIAVTIVVAFGLALRVAESFTIAVAGPDRAAAAITYSASGVAVTGGRCIARSHPNLGKNDERKPVSRQR
jgi:hypothetical protein